MFIEREEDRQEIIGEYALVEYEVDMKQKPSLEASPLTP